MHLFCRHSCSWSRTFLSTREIHLRKIYLTRHIIKAEPAWAVPRTWLVSRVEPRFEPRLETHQSHAERRVNSKSLLTGRLMQVKIKPRAATSEGRHICNCTHAKTIEKSLTATVPAGCRFSIESRRQYSFLPACHIGQAVRPCPDHVMHACTSLLLEVLNSGTFSLASTVDSPSIHPSGPICRQNKQLPAQKLKRGSCSRTSVVQKGFVCWALLTRGGAWR